MEEDVGSVKVRSTLNYQSTLVAGTPLVRKRLDLAYGYTCASGR